MKIQQTSGLSTCHDLLSLFDAKYDRVIGFNQFQCIFRPDEMPKSEHRDTSCPVTPIERYNKTRKHRWPDAIGIGFPKCGTGTMGFIDCHSKIVFREAEPYFWNSWARVKKVFAMNLCQKIISAKVQLLIT